MRYEHMGVYKMNLKENDMDIVERGTRALINALGYSGFLKYISRVQMYKGGYFRAEEVVYTGVEVGDDKDGLV
jgi:hypothetical protein